MPEPRIAIGIATYRRPELLSALLESLVIARKPLATRVIVVDNDPEGSGRSAATSSALENLLYTIEPKPGIVAARNRFLELVEEDFVVFVDDDEWVEPDWLENLYECHRRSGAEVIAGPVIPEFPDEAPRWAIDGGFFDRQRHTTGTSLDLAATNNSFVSHRAILALDVPRFDDRYSETGGSDSDLFSRLKDAGATILWCDEAVVREAVPANRITWPWVKQRARRTGQVRARLLLDRGQATRVRAEGVARIVVGAIKLGLRYVTFRRPNAWALNPFHRGRGMLDALGGTLIREYKR